MIISRLIGGLGNQMFQYAAGRALSLKHQTDLFLDHSFLEKDPHGAYTKRNYELHVFNVNAEKASAFQTEPFLSSSSSRLKRVVNRFLPGLSSNTYFSESGSAFHSSFDRLGNNVYLDGFWQSYKYFSSFDKEIRKDFTFRHEPDERNKTFLRKISEQNSIAVHVRRNDYVTNQNANAHHGLASLDYYNRAISMLAGDLNSPHIYFFSDDPEWVHDNLHVSVPFEIISHNSGDKNYEDLRLMSACKFNIIANSSFSWWAAWLNNHSNKKVIAPQQWFADPSVKTNDLCPPEWIRI